MTNENSAIGQAWEAAFAAAKLDSASMRLDGWTVSVEINGSRYRAQAHMLTVDGVKAALVECMQQHCALTAARTVAGC